MQSSRVDRGVGWVCMTQQCVEDESTCRCCQYRPYKVEGPHLALASEGPVEKDSAMVAVHRTAW
jgi:hypothetical protein